MTTLTKTVTLNPNQSQEVSFAVTPAEPGFYTVRVDGLSGSFSAIEEVPPIPPTDYINLSKDKLYLYLINGDVGRDWWNIPESDRRALALNILDWWSRPLGLIATIGLGEPNCAGGIYQQEGTYPATCHYNACIRCCLFADGVSCNNSHYYYSGYREWYCLAEKNFHLPIAYCTVARVTLPDGRIASHAINAIQVGIDPLNFNNWIFFQYGEWDIKPGNRQMPKPNLVRMDKPLYIGFGAYGESCRHQFIVNFDINEEGVATPVLGTIIVRVYGTYLGDRIPGALVTCDGYSCITDENGECRFDDLMPGDYTVTASKSGYITNSRTVTVKMGVVSGRSIQLIKE